MKISALVSKPPRNLLLVAALCGLLVSLAPTGLTGMGAKPVPNATAVVTFHDALNDRITSDGGGGYQHNSGGVSAQVFAASGDLILDVGGSTRSLNFDFMEVVEGIALGTLPNVQARMFVEGIGKMSVNSTALKPVRFGLGPALPNHVLVFRDLTQAGTDVNGTPVLVERSGLGTWTIQTVATTGSPDPSQAGDVGAVFEEKTVKGKLQQTVKGRYRMPFAVDVTCLTNCPPNP